MARRLGQETPWRRQRGLALLIQPGFDPSRDLASRLRLQDSQCYDILKASRGSAVCSSMLTCNRLVGLFYPLNISHTGMVPSRVCFHLPPFPWPPPWRVWGDLGAEDWVGGAPLEGQVLRVGPEVPRGGLAIERKT